jgi:hypothetical protein
MKEIKTEQPKLQLKKKAIAKLSSTQSKKILGGGETGDPTGFSILGACDLINVIQSFLLGKGTCRPN